MDSDYIRALLRGVPMPLVLVGGDERIFAANAAALALFGPAIEGRHYVTVLRQPAVLDAIEGTLRHRQPSQARYLVTEIDREASWQVEINALPPGAAAAPPGFGGSAVAGGVVVSFRDTSDLERIGQMRRDFVANVSHELRSPLTALLGFIETLRGAARDDPAARDRFLSIMEREAERMNRLVRDLLSLSRVEAEERVRPTEMLDVVQLLSASLSALRPMAREAGVEIETLGTEEPIAIAGDADQLTQVFHNLLENAIKYGGGKKVSVAVSRDTRDPALRGPSVRIDFIDRGEGIDAIHLPRLTERFYRVDRHRSREKGGTGLGLAIVKHIVNRHRGRFRIDSEKGKGSRFSVILPAP